MSAPESHTVGTRPQDLSPGAWLGRVFGILILAVFALFFIVPLLWLLVAPSKTDRQLLLEAPFSIGNIDTLVANWMSLMTFQNGLLWTWIGNSIFYCVAALVITLAISIPEAASDAMLARTRLCDHALRAELVREQHLSDRVVDLVRTRVREVLALQPHIRTPALRQTARMSQRRRPADPAVELLVKLGEKFRIAQEAVDTFLQTIERRHERFWNVTATERAEAPALVGIGVVHDCGQHGLRIDVTHICFHLSDSTASRAARTN